jgi:hypothetical protein
LGGGEGFGLLALRISRSTTYGASVSGLPIKERHREGVFGTVYRAEREKDQKVLNASITTLITFKGLRHQGSKTVNGHAKARPHVLQVMNWREKKFSDPSEE